MAVRRRPSLVPLRTRPQRLLVATATAASISLLFLVLVLVLLSTSLPSSPPSSRRRVTARSSSSSQSHHCGAGSLGDLGDALVAMLPESLPFTVFAPSADAFRRVLNLRRLPNNASAAAAHATDARRTAVDGGDTDARQTTVDGGDTDDPGDSTYAVLSRVLGFCAVPRRLLAADVAPPPRGGKKVLLAVDSVSGLRIHVAREDDDAHGGGTALIANGVRSECVDIVRGEIVVHVMAGVLMDAEFERSFAARLDSSS